MGCEILAERQIGLPTRRTGAFKNEFGHVAVLAGDSGGGGAALMAAEAALRCGAGLVSVGTRAEHVGALLARRPELMVRTPAGKLAALELLKAATVALVGPGLGQAAWGQQLFAAALDSGLPIVVDADALNLLAAAGGSLRLPKHSVITPHSGEAARLLACSTRDVEADRVSAVTELARRYNCIAVLKGAGTLIATPRAGAGHDKPNRGLRAICALGNPGMASAGMGDTLAGLIAGVAAQQQLEAHWVGVAVQVHAAAGDRAAARLGQASLLASDLISEIPAVLGAGAELS